MTILAPSRLEHGTDIAAAGSFFREPKGSALAHFSCCAQQGTEGRASKTTSQADAPDADGREVRELQWCSRYSRQNVHRAIHRADQRGDVVLVGDAWRVENICARFLVSLKPG